MSTVMTGLLEGHCQHCSVVSSDSTSVEVALDSYEAVSVVNFKPDVHFRNYKSEFQTTKIAHAIVLRHSIS